MRVWGKVANLVVKGRAAYWPHYWANSAGDFVGDGKVYRAGSSARLKSGVEVFKSNRSKDEQHLLG